MHVDAQVIELTQAVAQQEKTRSQEQADLSRLNNERTVMLQVLDRFFTLFQRKNYHIKKEKSTTAA